MQDDDSQRRRETPPARTKYAANVESDRWLAWRKENKVAIDSMNRYVTENGLFSDRYQLR